MQRIPSFARMFAVLACLGLFTLAAFADEKKGLYADEKEKTSGDIKDRADAPPALPSGIQKYGLGHAGE